MRVHKVGLVLCVTDANRGKDLSVATTIASSDRAVCIQLDFKVNRTAYVASKLHALPTIDDLVGTLHFIDTGVGSPGGRKIEIGPQSGDHLIAGKIKPRTGRIVRWVIREIRIRANRRL